MKTMFILALITLAASSAVAQLYTSCSQCYGCMQQQQVNICRAFLQQCGPMTTPFVGSQMWQPSSCQMMHQQCCQQLAQISEQSRCQAICGVAQAMMQQRLEQAFYQPLQQQVQYAIMRMVLQTLPSMCNVYVPEYCATTPCSTPMSTTCVGGAC